jgi:hypothetical protein
VLTHHNIQIPQTDLKDGEMIYKTRIAHYFVRLAVSLSVLAVIGQGENACAGKKKQPDFQVETDVTHYYNGWVGWHDQEGAFVAIGMINDAGSVVEDYPFGDAFLMTLSGKDGEIDVFVQITKFTRTKHGDTTKYRGHFAVVGGTGAYADIEASGSASGVEQWILIDPIWIIEAWTSWQLDGFVTSW